MHLYNSVFLREFRIIKRINPHWVQLAWSESMFLILPEQLLKGLSIIYAYQITIRYHYHKWLPNMVVMLNFPCRSEINLGGGGRFFRKKSNGEHVWKNVAIEMQRNIHIWELLLICQIYMVFTFLNFWREYLVNLSHKTSILVSSREDGIWLTAFAYIFGIQVCVLII